MGLLKKGDVVKFVNNKDLFSEWIWSDFRVPIIGKLYVVRAESSWGGVLLDGVENEIYRDSENGYVGEPGFSMDRFELVQASSDKRHLLLGELRESLSHPECKSINDVLDKINKLGMESLSKSELEILKRGTK